MSSEKDVELNDFLALFLETRGAVVEKKGTLHEALLPEDLAAFLGVSDYVSLGEGPGDEKVHNLAANYGSPLLEKIVDTACGEVPLLAVELRFDYMKSQGFDRLVAEQVRFQQAANKIQSHANVRTQYLLLTCRYRAQSDEQKEGLLQFCISLDSGAMIPGMAEMLPILDRVYRESSPGRGLAVPSERIVGWVTAHAASLLEGELRPFRENMTRRFRRDAQHLHEYYRALKQEMLKSLERPGLSEALIENRREKIALLPAELERKREDLFKKYSIQVTLTPCAVIWITTPAVKVLCRVTAGKKSKDMSLMYNPVTKAIDPMVCEGCGRGMNSISFCEGLHMLCEGCGKGCPICR